MRQGQSSQRRPERSPQERDKKYAAYVVSKTLVLAAALILIFTFVVGFLPVKGGDMYPKILDGDLCLFYRLDKSPKITEVMVYSAGGSMRIGRVVARGGDTVDMTEAGELIVNGNVQAESVYYETEKGTSIQYPYTVPEGSYFLLGDCRTDATDSRTFGACPASQLIGKVIIVMRHRGI